MDGWREGGKEEEREGGVGWMDEGREEGRMECGRQGGGARMHLGNKEPE